MRQKGYTIHEAPFDVSDEEAVQNAFARFDEGGHHGRHPGEQRGHSAAQANSGFAACGMANGASILT